LSSKSSSLKKGKKNKTLKVLKKSGNKIRSKPNAKVNKSKIKILRPLRPFMIIKKLKEAYKIE